MWVASLRSSVALSGVFFFLWSEPPLCAFPCEMETDPTHQSRFCSSVSPTSIPRSPVSALPVGVRPVRLRAFGGPRLITKSFTVFGLITAFNAWYVAAAGLLTWVSFLRQSLKAQRLPFSHVMQPRHVLLHPTGWTAQARLGVHPSGRRSADIISLSNTLSRSPSTSLRHLQSCHSYSVPHGPITLDRCVSRSHRMTRTKKNQVSLHSNRA